LQPTHHCFAHYAGYIIIGERGGCTKV